MAPPLVSGRDTAGDEGDSGCVWRMGPSSCDCTLLQATAALLHAFPHSTSQSLLNQVFDVHPLWGELQPGESQLVTFTFFGHPNIVARVMALCHVEGGPTYEVAVTGEASPLATNWMWKRLTEHCRYNRLLLSQLFVLESWPAGSCPPQSQALSPSQLLCWLWGFEYNP